MRIMVCGSRDWTSADVIQEALDGFPIGSTVIHGGCRGADEIAGAVARRMGYLVEAYPAEWSTLGRKAGPIRNARMIGSRPDVVLAFLSGSARGTRDAMEKARRAGIPLVVFGTCATEDVIR